MLNPVHRMRIKRFEAAVKDMALKGSMSVDRQQEVVEEYEEAKAALENTITHLYNKKR